MKALDIIAVLAVILIQAASLPALIGVITHSATIPPLMPILYLIGLGILSAHSFITQAAFVYKLANLAGFSLNLSILYAIYYM